MQVRAPGFSYFLTTKGFFNDSSLNLSTDLKKEKNLERIRIKENKRHMESLPLK